MRKEFLALAAAASITACAEGKQPQSTTEAMGLPKTGAAATMRPPTTPRSLEDQCRDINGAVLDAFRDMVEVPVSTSHARGRYRERLQADCRALCEQKAYGDAVQHRRTLAAEQVKQTCLEKFGLSAQ